MSETITADYVNNLLSERALLRKQIDALTAECSELHAEIDNDHKRMSVMTKAPEELAIPGNEPHPGNSKGNRIAQKALDIDSGSPCTCLDGDRNYLKHTDPADSKQWGKKKSSEHWCTAHNWYVDRPCIHCATDEKGQDHG